MNGQQTDSFTAKLSRELEVLTAEEREDLFMSIERRDRVMRESGQERPIWLGPAPVPEILGRDVVISTECGERRGRVICFGIVPDAEELGSYERSVIVFVPSSGTCHEGPGSLTRLAHQSDLERSSVELVMASRLRTAIAQSPIEPKQKSPKRASSRDDALTEQLMKIARLSPCVATVDEKKGSHKIVGMNGLKMYVLKGTLRVDLSGFTLEHPAVNKLSEQQAKDLHLGGVRGQILFTDRLSSMDAFELALEKLL